MTKVYAEAGRLRKQCPACKAYIHSRSTICPGCNTELVHGAKAKQEKIQGDAARYDKGGRGRKQCGGCSQYVGARIQVCICGYDFAAAKAIEPEIKKSAEYKEARILMEAMGYIGLPIMYVPQQDKTQFDCLTPISLREYDEYSVAGWAEDMLTAFHAKGFFCSPFCLRYFVRQLVPANKVKQVMEYLNIWQGTYV